MTKDEISAFCVDQLVDILRVPKDQIDVNAQFARLGLDSAMTIYLTMEIEDKLEIELDQQALIDHPTIDQLSAYLATKTNPGAAGKQAG